MLSKLHSVTCLIAIITPICELIATGTVTGLSFIPLGIAVFWGLGLMSAEPKRQPANKQPLKTTLIIEKKGNGWN